MQAAWHNTLVQAASAISKGILRKLSSKLKEDKSYQKALQSAEKKSKTRVSCIVFFAIICLRRRDKLLVKDMKYAKHQNSAVFLQVSKHRVSHHAVLPSS